MLYWLICSYCIPWPCKDILLNVFLAIAVDNLADAENLTEMEEEKKKKKEKAKEKLRASTESQTKIGQDGAIVPHHSSATHSNMYVSFSVSFCFPLEVRVRWARRDWLF